MYQDTTVLMPYKNIYRFNMAKYDDIIAYFEKKNVRKC